jgi:hypothetical protein
MKISVAAFQLLVPLICYLIDGLPTTGASGAGTGKHGCNFNLMFSMYYVLLIFTSSSIFYALYEIVYQYPYQV